MMDLKIVHFPFFTQVLKAFLHWFCSMQTGLEIKFLVREPAGD